MSSFQEKFLEFCEDQSESVPVGDERILLDEHQKEAMREICLALEDGERKFSVVHSCGAGKTMIEANLLIAARRAREAVGDTLSKDLMITTERALIRSISGELKRMGVEPGIWGAGEKTLDKSQVLASIQALQMNVRHDVDHALPADQVGLVIADEADLCLTPERIGVIQNYDKAIHIGLTATPKWPDGRDISAVWGRKVHEMPLKEGILKGVNVPPLFQLFEAQLDDQTLKVEQGDYEKKTLAAALREAEIHKAIPEIYERMIPKDQRKKYPTLVFVPSVNLVHDVVQTMTERFAAEGVNIKGWSGERTTTKSMQEDLDAYNKGEIDVLVLCEMGGRGINLPRARCLIDAYPTMSPTKLEQRHGRVLRTIRKDSELGREGFLKRFAYVAQVVPKSNRFRPFLLPDLLDCWDDFKQGRILGVQKSHRGQAGDTHEGRSIASEIDELRTHFEEQKPLHRVTLIKQIDVYEQLKLRENLPQADAEGFFTLSTGEGEQMSVERFGTAAAWSKEFKTTPITVRKTLANLTGITGKDARGKIHKEIFFAESVVRQACADFLKQIPQADEKGFFTMVNTEIEPNAEERYGTLHAWAKEMNTYPKNVRRYLEGKIGITGKDNTGKTLKYRFFAESVVREACADFLKQMPKADEKGFFTMVNTEIEPNVEERYGAVAAWARELEVSTPTIHKRLKGKIGITGKSSGGQVLYFFAESVVRKACANDLHELPRADHDGFIIMISEHDEKKVERYASMRRWGKELEISEGVISERLKKKNKSGISGKDSRGKPWKNAFFAESDVREACADLLKDVPRADENGFFMIITGEADQKKSERYGTISAWMRELKISRNGLVNHLKDKISIAGINARGKFQNEGFFAESVVREVCADLIEKKKADKGGGLSETV